MKLAHETMKNKITKSNGILYKIKNFLDRKTLTHLYNSFVIPYLIYGLKVWGNTNTVHLDPIINIQKEDCQDNHIFALLSTHVTRNPFLIP